MKSNNHTNIDKVDFNPNENSLVQNRIDPDTLFADIDDDSENNSENDSLLSNIDKISKELCTKILLLRSIETENKNNRIMETTKFTKAELNAIANRLNAIHTHGSDELHLKEKLVSYYMTTDENLTQEEAEQTISRLISGVDDLTFKYKAALENGWNPNEDIAALTANMTTAERYDFLVNAISVLNSININTLGVMSDVNGSLEATIAELKSSHLEVTNQTCDELQEILAELLETSSLMLTGEDKVKEMLSASCGQTTNVIDFASSLYDDYRYKNEMALAAWIEHKNDNITSLPEAILPEALGASIAAGVEEARILDEASSGNKSWDWAIKALKILGAVALVCFLGYIALLGLALVACSFFEAAILVMGTSSAAIFIATALSFLVSWGYCEVLIKFGTKVVNWCGEAYSWATDKLKEKVVPLIKKGADKLKNWFKATFGGNDKPNDNFKEITHDEQVHTNSIKTTPNVLSLSEDEIDTINTLVQEYTTAQNTDKSVKENLIDFYMTKFPGVHPKNAGDIIDSMINGITIFNDTLNDALKQDIENGEINFTTHLSNLTADMSAKDKYEIYINYLSLLTAIERSNVSLDDMAFTKSVEEIKNNLIVVDDEPTDEMIEEVLVKINELLNNSSICITSAKTSGDLLKALNNGDLETSLIQDQESDMRNKLIMSVMTYIALKNGTITSVSGDNVTPESIALGVSAGIETQKVITDLSQNKISESKAIRLLRIIGGVLLVTSLIVATLVAITYGVTGVMLGVFAILGEGILACIVASIATVVVAFGITGLGMIFGEKIISVADKIFDTVIGYFNDKVIPSTTKLVKQVSDWIKDKIGLSSSNDDTDSETNNEY